MMATARRLSESERFLRRGEWIKTGFHDQFVGGDVHGTTLGILGMGRIGQAIARREALGFGMRVIYHNRSQFTPTLEAESRARWVDKATLLRESDHLVLVLPYSPASHHAIGAAELAQMKPTATLTNIARGGIVDDAALAAALRRTDGRQPDCGARQGAECRPAADAGESRGTARPGDMNDPRILVMGVAGSGKSTLAAQLARERGIASIEGDRHHSLV